MKFIRLHNSLNHSRRGSRRLRGGGGNHVCTRFTLSRRYPFLTPPLLPLSAAPVPAGNSGAYFIYEAGGRIDNLQRRYVNAASRTLAVPLFPLPPWRRMGEEKGRMMEENREGREFCRASIVRKNAAESADSPPPLRGNAATLLTRVSLPANSLLAFSSARLPRSPHPEGHQPRGERSKKRFREEDTRGTHTPPSFSRDPWKSFESCSPARKPDLLPGKRRVFRADIGV